MIYFSVNFKHIYWRFYVTLLTISDSYLQRLMNINTMYNQINISKTMFWVDLNGTKILKLCLNSVTFKNKICNLKQ